MEKEALKIRSKIIPLFLGSLCLFCPGCHYHSEPPLTQLQIREMQTRVFEEKNALAVLKEMMNVLQDDAFIVKNANAELGLIFAEKEIDLETGWSRFFGGMTTHPNTSSSWQKNRIIEASANVSQFGSHTKVRVNFQRKVYDNYGRVISVIQIYDPLYYQDFFIKVHQGLFIQQAQI